MENEVRLIDANKAEAVLRNIADHLKEAGNTDLYPATYAAADVIKQQRTIDPETLRPNGRWEKCFEDWRQQIEGDKCSACGFEHYGSSIEHYHYCPNCGAKMEG